LQLEEPNTCVLKLNELMVAGLIHDLRTPLMAINLSAEVVLVRSQETAVQQAARRIRSSSERMSRIFDHLLNLSRVGASTRHLQLREADLGAEVAGVIAEVRAANPEARFEVSPEGDLNGVFDIELLRCSVDNFIATSLQYAGDSGLIKVELDGSHRDRLWLRVCVAGVIPAEEQERLFDPGPSVHGLEAGGIGFGLQAVDGFVRAHGGSVLGRSRAPAGTEFELLLPRGVLPEPAGAAAKPDR
jgi:two-component system sensor histidine kinase/response regulator